LLWSIIQQSFNIKEMHMPTKRFKAKMQKNCLFHGSHYDRKSQLSGVLTQPLNPRDTLYKKRWFYWFETSGKLSFIWPL